MKRDILGCRKYGEITIEYCSFNRKEHAGFIAWIVIMGLGFHAERGGAGFSIKGGAGIGTKRGGWA